MDIRISKESDVPIYEQVAAQILFLIGTGKLKPGDPLPSVRALARKLKIHHTTVSQDYQDLALQKLVVRPQGKVPQLNRLQTRFSQPCCGRSFALDPIAR